MFCHCFLCQFLYCLLLVSEVNVNQLSLSCGSVAGVSSSALVTNWRNCLLKSNWEHLCPLAGFYKHPPLPMEGKYIWQKCLSEVTTELYRSYWTVLFVANRDNSFEWCLIMKINRFLQDWSTVTGMYLRSQPLG